MNPEPDVESPPPNGVAARPAWRPRFFEPGDEERIVRMLNSAFGGWPTGEVSVPKADHLRWKLSSHPVAASLCIVTEHDDRVVGWQAYWLQNVKLDDRELLSRQNVDFAVDPDYQRMGVRLAMFDKAAAYNPRRNFALHFEPPSGHPALVHMGKKTDAAAKSLLAQRVEARVLRVGDVADDSGASTPWTVRNVPRFDERVDRVFDAASTQFRLMVVRRCDYLNWRYADPRAGNYVITAAEQDGQLLGYVVSRASSGRGLLADMLVLPDRLDILRALVAAAFGRAVLPKSSAGCPSIIPTGAPSATTPSITSGAAWSIELRPRRSMRRS